MCICSSSVIFFESNQIKSNQIKSKMEFTKQSKMLLSQFIITHKDCFRYSTLTPETKSIIAKLYDRIQRASIVSNQEKGEIRIRKITERAHIPQPKHLVIPNDLRDRIYSHAMYHVSHSFSLFSREIIIHLVFENEVNERKRVQSFRKHYEECIAKIKLWLAVASELGVASPDTCSKNITIYIYMTPITKQLPSETSIVLDQRHVNTAYTYTCKANNDIVIYRKEEWFKVLIHETFHTLALDFSDMDSKHADTQILSIFRIESNVLLYEAYTECWARIWNVLLCCFYLSTPPPPYQPLTLKPKNPTFSLDKYLEDVEMFIIFERTFGCFQMIKALHHMGLKYSDIISSFSLDSSNVKTVSKLYKERSNVLSYYIITLVLMNHYQEFMKWCNVHNNTTLHNTSLVSFKKTNNNLNQFVRFVEKNHQSREMMEGVECVERTFFDIHKHKNDKKNKKMEILTTTMRMTICELA